MNWWQEVYDREYSEKKRNFNADDMARWKKGKYKPCGMDERSWLSIIRIIRQNAKMI